MIVDHEPHQSPEDSPKGQMGRGPGARPGPLPVAGSGTSPGQPADFEHGIPSSVVIWTLRRFWWAVIVVGLSLGLAAYTLLNSINPGYQSQARVLVGQLAGSTDSLRASASLGQTYADALASETLLRRVSAEAGLTTTSVSDVLSAADVQFTVNSRILTIQMTWSDPRTAQRLADLMVAEVMKLKQQGPQTALVKDPTPDVRSQELTRQGSGDLTLIQPATVPDQKVDAHSSTVAMLAAVAGGITTFTLLCFWGGRQYRWRMRVRRTIAPSDYLGSAVRRRGAHRNRNAMNAVPLETHKTADYVQMAARIEVRATVAPLRSLCIVGTRNGPVAAEVALNLAAAFAGAGRNVTLVDTTGSAPAVGLLHSHLTTAQVETPQEQAELAERLRRGAVEGPADQLHVLALPSLVAALAGSRWLTSTDAVILVGEYDDPSVQLDIVDCMDAIVRQGGQLLGVVLLLDGRPLSRLTSLPESVMGQ